MTTMQLSPHARHWGELWGSRPARLGRDRGAADPGLRGGARPRTGRARRPRARRRLRHRRVPAHVRGPRGDRQRDRRRRQPARGCTSARPRGRHPAWRHAGAPVPRRHVRHRDRLHAVLLRRGYGRGARGGRARRSAGRADRHAGLRPARALRPRGDEGRGRAVPPGAGDDGAESLLAARHGRGAGRGRRAAGASRRSPARRRTSTPTRSEFLRAMLAAGGAARVAGPERRAELRAAPRSAADWPGCRAPDDGGSTASPTSGSIVIARPGGR